MAVAWKVDMKCTQEWRCFPEALTIPPSPDRHVLPDIEWLVEDMMANGQSTPIQIRKDGGKPILITGRSRWRAAIEINKRLKAAGQAPRMLRCSYMEVNEEEAFRIAIAENHQRNALDPLDYAYQIKYLGNVCAMTEDQIALVYFPGAKGEKLKDALRFVRKHAKLINLSKPAEKALREGKLKESAAYKLAKLSSEQQKQALEEGEKPQPKAPRKLSIKTQIREAIESSMTPDGHVLVDGVTEWLRSLIQ
jgi:ParB-like chromosome segregation protein Spo0J